MIYVRGMKRMTADPDVVIILESRSYESLVRQPAHLPRCSNAPNYEEEH